MTSLLLLLVVVVRFQTSDLAQRVMMPRRRDFASPVLEFWSDDEHATMVAAPATPTSVISDPSSPVPSPRGSGGGGRGRRGSGKKPASLVGARVRIKGLGDAVVIGFAPRNPGNPMAHSKHSVRLLHASGGGGASGADATAAGDVRSVVLRRKKAGIAIGTPFELLSEGGVRASDDAHPAGSVYDDDDVSTLAPDGDTVVGDDDTVAAVEDVQHPGDNESVGWRCAAVPSSHHPSRTLSRASRARSRSLRMPQPVFPAPARIPVDTFPPRRRRHSPWSSGRSLTRPRSDIGSTSGDAQDGAEEIDENAGQDQGVLYSLRRAGGGGGCFQASRRALLLLYTTHCTRLRWVVRRGCERGRLA